MNKMTSKERVLATFANTEPDRVPRNFSSNPGIKDALVAHFRTKTHDELLDALKVDFRHINAGYTGPRLHEELDNGISVDPIWGIHRCKIEHGSGFYWDYCDFPLKFADVETVENWPMPSPDDYNYEVIKEACKNNVQYAIGTGGPGFGDIINSTGMLFTMEETLVNLIMEDEAMLRFLDRRLAILLETMERTIEAAGGGIDFAWLGEDLGTQKAPIISLELYRKVLRPRHQKFVDLAKSYDLPVMIHTCGSSSWVYEDFIEMGITVVDTLQPEAVNMSPEYLKNTFGGRLAFHGCISTAEPLTNGTVQEVDEYCRKTLEIMKPGGGYCFAPTHCLQDNSPLENVLTMYEACDKYGNY